MKGRRLLVLSVLAFAIACEDQRLPTAPAAPAGPSAPTDPSAIISDGAHCSTPGIACNPDFFFLPPMVPLPLHNANFELGKFNNTLQPSLKIDICELKSNELNTRGLPTAATGCVPGDPLKTFAPGTVKLVNLPIRQNGWWTLFGLPPDGFYYVLWDTRQSRLDVNKFYRIKVLIAGPPDVVLGVADVDPMSSLFQWKYTLTGEVIQLINGFFLPIPFRVEHGGGPTLCGGATLCASGTITNLPPGSPDQFVRVQGADGSFIAGVQIPADFLPPPPGPQSVVLTISRVNTGVNNVAAGTQTIPCHANLPLQQFNSCFHFSTVPELPLFPPNNEEGRQFLREITLAVCFVLIDQEVLDPREPWVQLWSSEAGGANAKPLPSASDAQILTAGTGRNCGNNLVGFNNNSTGFRGLASAGWRKVTGGLGRLFGVQTAYAVDLGLGGLSFDISNIGPALTARIQPYTSTGLTLGAGATTTSTVRIMGTQKHDHSGALTTGIGGLPVTFTVAPGNGTLRLIGSELPPATQLTSITNTQPIDPESPVSGGGFAPVNWTMPTTPGTYTLTATAAANGTPITFTATVAAALPIIFASSLVNGVGPSDLYTVQIGVNGVDTRVAQISTAAGQPLTITDIALLPDGSLVGVSYTDLYSINRQSGVANFLESVGRTDVVGLAASASGVLYASTSGGELLQRDVELGWVSRGFFGEGLGSSGDLAFAPNGTLYGTLRTFSGVNVLASIDASTGAATVLSPASGLGFGNVWGLSFVGSNLYGLTTDPSGPGNTGQLVQIDPGTGIATSIRSLSFGAGGAASIRIGDFHR